MKRDGELAPNESTVRTKNGRKFERGAQMISKCARQRFPAQARLLARTYSRARSGADLKLAHTFGTLEVCRRMPSGPT